MSLFEKFKRKKSNVKKKRLTLTVRDARSGAVESATPIHYLDTASSSCESSSYSNDCSGGGSGD